MNRLAVIFPGIGYTADKPLLHYSRRIAADHGFDVRVTAYSGFPPKVQGDGDRLMNSVQIALTQAVEMLSDVDFSAYEDILFVGKSIGTIVAAKIASESPVRDRIRLVLYTPLEATFSFAFDKAVVFTGDDDPWVGRNKSRISSICMSRSARPAWLAQPWYWLVSSCRDAREERRRARKQERLKLAIDRLRLSISDIQSRSLSVNGELLF